MAVARTCSLMVGSSGSLGLGIGQDCSNPQVGNGVKITKLVSFKSLRSETRSVKVRSHQIRMDSMQPSTLRREALVGIGASVLTICFPPAEPAEARTSKLEVRKKIQEKLDELREKAGVKREKNDEKSSTESKKTPKSPPQKDNKIQNETLVTEVDFSG